MPPIIASQYKNKPLASLAHLFIDEPMNFAMKSGDSSRNRFFSLEKYQLERELPMLF